LIRSAVRGLLSAAAAVDGDLAVRLHTAIGSGDDYASTAKPVIDWDEPAARDMLVDSRARDGYALLGVLDSMTDLPEPVRQAMRLLATVLGQDLEDDGAGGLRIARKVAADRVISTVDPEARHVHKTVHHRQDGYKGHVAIEPDTGLFTTGTLTKATGEANHESVIGLALLNNEDDALEVLADSAYGTGDTRAQLRDRGHTAIIKPGPLKPPVPGGFTIDDFTVDEHAGTVTCPNGLTRRITAHRSVVFGVACRDCPLRARCTTSKTGRTLNLHPHDALLRHARHQWREDDHLRATYRQHRPMVERSIAWLVGPKGRCRTLRYRGAAAGDWWLHTRMAALNLRRLLNLGLVRHTGTWALA
jgi:hypothetical protein